MAPRRVLVAADTTAVSAAPVTRPDAAHPDIWITAQLGIDPQDTP